MNDNIFLKEQKKHNKKKTQQKQQHLLTNWPLNKRILILSINLASVKGRELYVGVLHYLYEYWHPPYHYDFITS